MAAPRTLPGLRKSDFKSDVWERLSARLTAQIEILRDNLESRENTEASSAATRGRISALREILALERAPADALGPLTDVTSIDGLGAQRPAPAGD